MHDALVCIIVLQHHRGAQHDLDASQQRPVGNIFEIGLQPVGDVLLALGRAAVAAHLRKPGKPRLQAMALPVSAVDFLEELVVRLTADRVRARADDRHLALEHVDQLRELVDAGAADEGTDAGDPVIVARGRAAAVVIELFLAHRAELEHVEENSLPRPSRRWMKSTGPPSSSLIATATAISSGESPSSAAAATAVSKVRLMIRDRSRKGPVETTSVVQSRCDCELQTVTFEDCPTVPDPSPANA